MKAIKVEKLQKHFGSVKAIDNVSFNIDKGEIFGFLGPNGAGKTTAIRCMMDFIKPDSGKITILGKDAQKDSVEIKSKVGYVSGNVRLYAKWTGAKHINFVDSLNGNKNRAAELAERFDFDVTKKAKTLSSGNRQKLGLILALMTEPKLLIFDEPTNALDPLLQLEVYEILKEEAKKGVTVFMSSHNLAEVERICSKVAVIKKGKLVQEGDIAKLKRKKVYTVRALLGKTISQNESFGESAEIQKIYKNEVILKVKGSVQESIESLTKHKIKDLEVTHASLEDIFLEHYND